MPFGMRRPGGRSIFLWQEHPGAGLVPVPVRIFPVRHLRRRRGAVVSEGCAARRGAAQRRGACGAAA
eukprot:457589-Prymnesium_polylepis.1